MADFGPIQLVAMAFPDPRRLQGALLSELYELSRQGIVRVIGLTAIVKDENGTIGSVQTTELSDEDRVKLAGAVGALIGFGEGGEAGATAGAARASAYAAGKEYGLTKEQIQEIARGIPRGSAAGFLLVEHLWAKRLMEQAAAQDGVILANNMVSENALVGLGAQLAEGARIVEQVQYQ